jgi:CRISPR/Cas system-associated protein Csx1
LLPHDYAYQFAEWHIFLAVLVHIAAALSFLYFTRSGAFVDFLPDSLRFFEEAIAIEMIYS